MRAKLLSSRAAALVCALILALMGVPPASEAQGASGASRIAGIVSDADGLPLADVVVEARHVTSGFRVRARTARSGRFVLFDMPLGEVTVMASRLGFAPAPPRRVVLSMGDQPLLTLVLAVLPRDTVRVIDRRLPARGDRIGGSTMISRQQIDVLPVPDRNFTSLAALSSRTGSQLSLGGQRWTSTDIRIDGVQSRNMLRAGESNGGPSGIPLDAIQAFEVNTSVFDAAKGRQGGGELSAVTRMGGNATSARLTTFYRNEQLAASSDFLSRPRRDRAASTAQFALTASGAIVRDRAHWLLAVEQQESSEPLRTGDVSTTAAQVASGIARDSLARILAILAQRYGTDTAQQQLGALARTPQARTALLRGDWQLSEQHRGTLRVTTSDWHSPLSGGVDQAIALREARSSFSSREWQVVSELSSQWSATTHHGLQLALGSSRRALIPESDGVPRGFVQVRSRLPDGTTGNTTVQFGGNRLAPDDSRERTLQLRDRLDFGRGRTVVSVGMDHALTTLSTRIAESQSGLFVFPSIAALASMSPNRFTRTVPVGGEAPITRQHVLELGSYAQADIALSTAWRLTGGVRWDGTLFLSRAPAQPAVDAAFGVRTHRAPRDLAQWQPRAQLLWRRAGRDADVVRVGAGLFRAQLPYYAQHNALLYTGTSLTDIDVRGAAVPTPDFAGYRSGAAIPGVPEGTVAGPAFVNVNGTVRAPQTFKTMLAWSHQVTTAATLTISGEAQRLRDGYQYLDRNLSDAPAFRLAAEAGRGVWVPAASIVAATGVTDVRNAARVPGYARVLSLESAARASQHSASAEVSWTPRAALTWLAGYTWSHARDNSTYGCCLARTATTFTPIVDDPRQLAQAWGRADFDVRHRISSTVQATPPGRMAFALRYLGQSGRPISLVVDGDINGDEANGNDLAFLFDPDALTTPADVAASMRLVMANPRNIARRYIATHLGTIAQRNAIETPWSHRVDARLSHRIALRGGRGAVLLLDVLNAGNLLNRRWGAQYLLPAGISSQNPVVTRLPLLRVVGFDPATQRYRYSVNEGAGVLTKGGEPYQMQVGVRVEW
jgi:hypothetical protein